MQNIKTIGIKNLKNNLSAYLREVRRGWRVLITDRDQVVAELREPLTEAPLTSKNPLLAEWVRTGKIHPAKTSKHLLSLTGKSFPDGTVERLLREDRGE